MKLYKAERLKSKGFKPFFMPIDNPIEPVLKINAQNGGP